MKTAIKLLLSAVLLCVLAACATHTQQLPLRTATVIEARQSMRAVTTPSLGGAAVGAAVGGVAGNQIGKGSGRKVATVLGLAGGTAIGAAAGSRTSMVPTTWVVLRDDVTGEVLNTDLDGAWQVGMRVRFSISGEKFVMR